MPSRANSSLDATSHVIVADARQQACTNAKAGSPTAVFVGLPPTYFANEAMSSSRPPTCSPYRSTLERPIVNSSSLSPTGFDAPSAAFDEMPIPNGSYVQQIFHL